MEFSPVEIRTWSILGPRGTFGVALTKLAEENAHIVAMSADLRNTSGLDRFYQAYPERFLNVGIAEQNLIGVAAGISDSGDIPFASTFANFISLRACEQVRHFLGYMQCNVKLVGIGAGFAMELFGNTHYGVEDIATLQAIPNLVILSPADGLEIVKTVNAAAFIEAPIYIRLTGMMNHPIIYKKDYEFRIGKAVTLREGTDVAIIATGSMVSIAIEVAKVLAQNSIECRVINMHTIKPIDKKVIKESAGCKLIVTIEEHRIIGGLGSAVAEVLVSEKIHSPLLKLGVGDTYLEAGDYAYMLEQCGLTVSHIKEEIVLNLVNAKL